MELTRGFKDKLEKYVNINQSFSVEMKIKGSAEYDFCCFGVDSAGKLSDDRYMIFYNQTVSPGREITMQNIAEGVQYSLNLSALPLSVQRIVFTASIDGAETMSQIDNFSLTLQQAGGTALGMQLGTLENDLAYRKMSDEDLSKQIDDILAGDNLGEK